jgi:D-alanyl-D-alanine carboxypeptidase
MQTALYSLLILSYCAFNQSESPSYHSKNLPHKTEGLSEKIEHLPETFLAKYSSTASTQSVAADTVYLDSLMHAHEIPAMAYAVVTEDRVIAMGIRGYRKIEVKTETGKATLRDYFHLGSNTKAITGYVAAYWVEQKKLDWQTEFFTLFPEWKDSSLSAYHHITLQDLLSHQAGIRPFTSGLEFRLLPPFSGTASEKRKAFAQHLLTLKPVGTGDQKAYRYSNAGYTLAALMLEKVSGKSWEELCQEVLQQKLKLDFIMGWPNQYSENQPFGHALDGSTVKSLPKDFDYNMALIEPASDISMNILDYVGFIQQNLKGLKGKKTLLLPETVNRLHLGLPKYAIGWGNLQDEGKIITDHAGSTGTFYVYALNDIKTGISYIVFMNTGTPKAQEGLFKWLAELKKLYH